MSELLSLQGSLDWLDSVDLASRIGALQLCPENASRAIRLEALAHLAASLVPGKTGTLSRKGLLKLCNQPPLGRSMLAAQEDPCENPFTEAFTFSGGNYIVFPGINATPTYILRNLCKAIFLGNHSFSNALFKRQAHKSIVAVLTLSNLVASRAQIQRNVPPLDQDGDVFVPGTERLRTLLNAVTIRKPDLEEVLGQAGVTLEDLSPYLTELGTVDLSSYRVEEGPLHRRPLLETSEYVIVVMPSALLTALRHQILCLSIECGVTEDLATLYSEAGWHSVKESLRLLRHHSAPISLPPISDGLPVMDGLFQLDLDKLLYVSLISDQLEGYAEDTVFGTWMAHHLNTQVSIRTKEVVDYLYTRAEGVNEVLVLRVYQGIGRLGPVDSGTKASSEDLSKGLAEEDLPLESGMGAILAGMAQRRELEDLERQSSDKHGNLTTVATLPTLALSEADLEVIAFTEGGNPLLLWQFATARDKFHQDTAVFGGSVLDEFYLYRKNQHSYYFSDGPRASGAFIQPGTGASLKCEVLQKFDFHAVVAPEENRVTEVVLLYGDSSVPIYVPRTFSSQAQVTVLYEGPYAPVWVMGPNYRHQPAHQALHSIYAQIADMITYWLWQADVALGAIPAIGASVRGWDKITVHLECTGLGNWNQVSQIEEAVESMIEESMGSIHLRIPPCVQEWLQTADNQGERRIMGIVIEALWRLLTSANPNLKLRLPEPTRLVDEMAPVGIKKKLLVIGHQADITLDESNTPPYRPVQAAAENEILDEVGEYLRSRINLSEGPIESDRRTEVLQKVVGYLYSELQSTVASLQLEGLLEALVAISESVIQNAAMLRLTIPTRLACFGSSPQMLKLLEEQLPEADKASLAVRFLIEYVVAKPPTGLRPFSLSVYDRLLALCSEIINWAYVSDLIRYNLADIQLSILASGRLGQDRKKLDRAHKAFTQVSTFAEIERATSSFRRHWNSPAESPSEGGRKPALPEVEEASQVEFGFSLTDQLRFLHAVIEVGQQQSAAAKVMSMTLFEAQIAQLTEWEIDKVKGLVELFMLRPRQDFLVPPLPFRKEDVYPWRFNRPLSYIRRPLLLVEVADGVKVWWGSRQVWRSSQYLVMILFTGRLHGQAKTKRLQQVLGEISHASGERFNDEVADVFRSYPSLHVIPRLRKVGKVRIGLPEQDLGDIDLVVIHSKRRRILVVECKDFALARNPHEIASEMENLIRGNEKKEAAVIKISKRGQWLSERVAQLLADQRLPPTNGKWRIEPLVVVSEESMTPHLVKLSVPFIALRTLRDFARDWSRG